MSSPRSVSISWRSYKAALLPKRFPDGIAESGATIAPALFNSQNPDKLSLTLDLKAPDGTRA